MNGHGMKSSFTRGTFNAVLLLLLLPIVHACNNFPAKSRIDRIKSGSLVVYGRITDHISRTGVGADNTQDRLITTVTLDVFCVLKNILLSKTLPNELKKKQIKFEAVWFHQTDCGDQNEVNAINSKQ